MTETNGTTANLRTVALAIGGMSALAGVAAALYLLVGEGEPAVPSESGTRLDAGWSAESGEPVALSLGAGGPVWRAPSSPDVGLAPALPEDAGVKWHSRETEGGYRLSATSERRGAEISYDWRLQSGDPQARFTGRLAGLSLERLRKRAFSISFRLPTDRVRYVGPDLRLRELSKGDLPVQLGPWTPLWLQWRSSKRNLTLRGWTGDGIELRRSGGDGLRLVLHLWQPELHPALRECALDDSSRAKRPAITASLTATFGRSPPLVATPIPAGEAAALVPIFDTPAAHPDTTLHAAEPKSASDWADRARTLTFGHSNHEDPRYGNGGLLGHGLGGTIVAPAKWAQTKALREFADEIDETNVSIGLRGPDPPNSSDDGPPPGRRTRLGTGIACSRLLETSGAPAGVGLPAFEPFRGRFDAPTLRAPGGPVAASATPYRLDGTRPELLQSALASANLRTLVERRGATSFATPLLATRNPLVAPAKEALLSPERHGEWTIASPFAESLATLELLREAEPLWVGSLSALVRHWRGARAARRKWTPAGELLVATGRDRRRPGYTLLAVNAGLPSGSIRVHGAERLNARQSRTHAGESDSSQTWMSWNLEPDQTYRVRFEKSPAAFEPPSPVRWRLRP